MSSATASKRALGQLVTLDLRALSLFRIALGVSVLYDVATRVPQLREHYTDAGSLPSDLARELAGRVTSLYLPIWSSASDAWVVALFALLALSALALVLGYRTRVASVVCWLLVVGLRARNPLVASFGGDTVLRMLLFWAMWLPLGRFYSLDARRAARGPDAAARPTQIRSVAAAALLLQMTLLYVTTGFAKLGTTWLRGSALYYALHCDYFGNAVGAWLREREAWLPPLSFAAMWLERLGPALLWVPVATDVFRMAACLLFLGLHLGLALLMDVGPFPLYTLAAWPAFLPSSLFDRWLPRLRGRAATVAAAGGPPPPLRQALWLQGLVALCLVYAFLHVASSSVAWGDSRWRLPGPLSSFGKLFQLQQNWDMFGPDPPRKDIWPIPVGHYTDGSRRNLLTGEPAELRRPDDLRHAVGSFRSRLYFRALYWSEPPLPRERLHAAWARFACLSSEREVEAARVAGAEPPPRLDAVVFHVGVETTRERGEHPVAFERLDRVSCPL